MVVRSLIALVACLLLGGTASACFGPKLYVGVSADVETEVLYALVTLYVKEKTGVESLRVDLTPDLDPLRELAENRLDLALSKTGETHPDRILSVPGYPILIAGERPLQDLQFTTVVPAIRKLEKLLSAQDVAALVHAVRSGTSSMAAVRTLLMERRWI